MIRNLKRKLYFLFASSIMFVFTIVFFLLASENIETMQNAELNFVNRQATNLTLLFEDSTHYVEKCFFPLFCWRQRLIDWFLRTETLKP